MEWEVGGWGWGGRRQWRLRGGDRVSWFRGFALACGKALDVVEMGRGKGFFTKELSLGVPT